jgi:hypothetical protein
MLPSSTSKTRPAPSPSPAEPEAEVSTGFPRSFGSSRSGRRRPQSHGCIPILTARGHVVKSPRGTVCGRNGRE